MRRLLRRASDEAGYSMAIVIMVLLACSGFVAAGYAAAQSDFKMSGNARDRKAAYAAAEAGLAYYVSRLNQDSDYWTNCTNVAPPSVSELSPVNNIWSSGTTDPRNWRALPGSKAKYTIELLPAPGYATCQEDVNQSMIDPTTASFRIRASGRAGGVTRSLIGVFKRKTFLHFLYFTDFETKDPIAYSESVDGSGRTPAWAASNCGDRYRPARHDDCTEIQFRGGDEIKGPFHTNDSVLMCEKPIFGRAAHVPVDTMETTLDPGYFRVCGAVDPVFNGIHTPGVDKMTLPTSNASLKDLASPGYTFSGLTEIELTGTNMTVTNNGTTTTKALPTDGVIYVKADTSKGCANVSTPYFTKYAETAGCANVRVYGEYKKNLTIAAANDVIVGKPGFEGVKKTGDAVLGLIAENFVRVYHKATWSGNSCTGHAEAMTDVRIDAAILALKHSFAVDNYGCGGPLGRLTINGAIAQKYRGVVGTSSGTTQKTGYLKDYNYDDRLRYRSPPQFLPPVEAEWMIARQTEQVPAKR